MPIVKLPRRAAWPNDTETMTQKRLESLSYYLLMGLILYVSVLGS